MDARLTTVILRLARCFPEAAHEVAFYRMYRGVDRRDVAEAHLRAVLATVSGSTTVNIAGPSPFHPDDMSAIWDDPWSVIERRVPGVRASFERRGWPLPQRIDRVYAIEKARRVLDTTLASGLPSSCARRYPKWLTMTTRAVLLVNLGSPDSPTEADVRRYLREFLMDPRVLDAPWPVRFFVVNATILPTRPRESAHAYSTIWTNEGSPLIVTSRRVQEKLQRRLSVPVALAMRYQNPSIEKAVKSLAAQGITETFLIPLFPHYAMSSYESAVERVRDIVRRTAPGMTLEVMPPYYAHPDYISALVATASDALAAPYDYVLFSFHGLPERHMRKADPTGQHCLMTKDCCQTPSVAHDTCYRAQCFATVRHFVASTGMPSSKYLRSPSSLALARSRGCNPTPIRNWSGSPQPASRGW